jgi:predicted phage replisome organizer
MSDNKKYYYLKLKDNFYDDDRIKIIEGMTNGVYYSNLLLKLYLKSLKTNGQLRFTKAIPYDENIISTITNINIDIVRVGINVLLEMQFIEKLDNGTIFMTEIQNFIGKSSTEADRVREYRNEISNLKLINENEKKLIEKTSENFNCTNVQQMYKNYEPNQKLLEVSNNKNVQMYDKCTPEKEIEKDIDIDIEIQKQHKIPEENNFVNIKSENFSKKDVVVESPYIKAISELFTKLTSRYPNYKDTSAMMEILDHPTIVPINCKSRLNIILKTMSRISSDYGSKNNDEGIKSFRYYLNPIKNELKKYREINKRSDSNGTETVSINEYGEKIDYNKFRSNKRVL